MRYNLIFVESAVKRQPTNHQTAPRWVSLRLRRGVKAAQPPIESFWVYAFSLCLFLAVTSSINAELHNVSQRHQKWTDPRPWAIYAEKLVKVVCAVPEICSRTDRQTDRHTNKLAHSNTHLTYQSDNVPWSVESRGPRLLSASSLMDVAACYLSLQCYESRRIRHYCQTTGPD